MSEAHLFFEAGATLGEGPRWDHRTNELHWVDIERGEIHRLGFGSQEHRVVSVGRSVGSAVPLADGDGWIAGLRDGVAVIAYDGDVRRFVPVDAERPRHRMNDGACDSSGRFWTGTLDEDHGPPSDVLYRVGPDLSVDAVVQGIGLSNGIAWSPDGQTMYRVDSASGTIFRGDFHADSATLSHEQPLVVIDASVGEPDGITVDADGYIWAALWDGWALRRYAPTGELDYDLRVPVARPTSCVFGGPDLATLFITTARTGLSDDDLAAQPWAGHILSCTPPVGGLPTNFFSP
jgi:sugar lactone lactonase YvrE